MNAKILEPVDISRIILAPPELVFDGWVKPELIRKWLFVGPTSEIVNVKLDLKIQGKFLILEHEKSTNEYIDHYGQYTEIVRPAKLAFTLCVPKQFPGEADVSIEIIATTGGSVLSLVQTGVPKNVMEPSWEKMLDQLSLTLENW